MIDDFGLGPRPAPAQADIDFETETRTPVGPELEGKVIHVDPVYHTGYIAEDVTGCTSGMSRALLDPAVFDSLQVGTRVRYHVNFGNCAVTLSIITP